MDSSTLLDTLTPEQRALHNNLVAAVADLRRDVVRTAGYLLAVQTHQVDRAMGFDRIGDYARTYAGLTPRQTSEFLHLGRRLLEMPMVSAALEAGQLTWAQAREICNHVTPETEQDLVDLAGSLPRAELRERLKKERAGSSKEPACVPEANPLPTDGSPSTNAPEQLPAPDSEPAPLHAPDPPRRNKKRRRPPRAGIGTRPSHAPEISYLQFKLHAEQLARWDSLIALLQRESPGATAIDVVLEALAAVAEGRAGARHSSPPFHLVLLNCPVCDDARLVTSRGEAEVPRAMLEAARCDAVVEGEDGHRRKTPSPSIRNLALQRARFRCEAEGCGNTHFLEVHHRQPAALGGGDDLDNLMVLCASCHRRLHEAEADMKHDRTAVERGAAARYGSRPSR